MTTLKVGLTSARQLALWASSCRRGVVKSWVPQSSVTCFVRCSSFFSRSEPCIVVFQVITLFCLSFFIFHKLNQVIFPPPGWSSCFSLRYRRYDKSQTPLGSFSGPSVWALVGDPQGLSPFQFLLCFDPICDLVSTFFHQLLFSSCTQSNFIFVA